MSAPSVTPEIIKTPDVKIKYIVYEVGYLYRYCPFYLKYIKAALSWEDRLELIGLYADTLLDDDNSCPCFGPLREKRFPKGWREMSLHDGEKEISTPSDMQKSRSYWRVGGTSAEFELFTMHDHDDALVFKYYCDSNYYGSAVVDSINISKILREVGHCACIGCIYEFDVERYPGFDVLVVRDDTEGG